MIAHPCLGCTRVRLVSGVVILSVLLSACAHKPASGTATATEGVNEQTGSDALRGLPNSGVASAATQPLADIGLRRDKIPDTLKSIKTPYAQDLTSSCEAIAQEIIALDLVLDLDVDVKLADQTWRQKGAGAAGDVLLDAIEATSTSVIPFRGVVREVSGASKRDREISAAIQAGKLRRAFLKGVGSAKGCAPPAAPLPYSDNEPD